jgi:hypothetical protein
VCSGKGHDEALGLVASLQCAVLPHKRTGEVNPLRWGVGEYLPPPPRVRIHSHHRTCPLAAGSQPMCELPPGSGMTSAMVQPNARSPCFAPWPHGPVGEKAGEAVWWVGGHEEVYLYPLLCVCANGMERSQRKREESAWA